MKKGGFTFVLHSHLPYCRKAGRWPHGEEWIHEAAAETYIPLLNSFYDLRAEGVKWKLTLGITPILAEQLADSLVMSHFEEYLHEKIVGAEKDIQRFSSLGMTQARADARVAAEKAALEAEERARIEAAAETSAQQASAGETSLVSPVEPKIGKAALEQAPDIKETATLKLASKKAGPDPASLNVPSQVAALKDAEDELVKAVEEAAPENEPPAEPDPRYYLAQWYLDWYRNILDCFVGRYGRNIINAFKILQDEGFIEIITCAATHGYLPLVSRDSTIYGQLAVAVASYERHFGRKPKAIWLPECAYRPAYYATNEQGQQYYKPGIEEFLAQQGIKLFFSETHTIEGGVPVGKAGLETLIGPYSYVQRRYVVPASETLPKTNNTTFSPYWVSNPQVAVIGRNNRTGMQVWSANWGYPGEKDYREFHRKDSGSGLQYWRVTGPKVDLGFKDYYHPAWAAHRVQEHTEHFVGLLEEELAEHYEKTGKLGILACNYDTELFGHWWFEGPEWIKQVLKKLSTSETVELTTASEWIEQHPPEVVLAIPESSWGQQGTHFVWLNPDTEWMWPLIHGAERRMENLVAQFGNDASGNNLFVLQQAARELLLLESSDWPFLVTTEQAKDYSVERFTQHLDRFNELADELEAVGPNGQIGEGPLYMAHRYYDMDNPFPDIDYKVFANRERILIN
ncbi:MAG: 1,4-alpha-glucan branching protein domain-containing protein [Chloroflexota bacterium]|nr:DUF1957 domain-containing protein [Chloroflexota bacterium]